MEFPSNLKYTHEHEWVSVQGNIGTIGITEYAQGELGDVVYVDINPDLKEITRAQTLGSIEAVKTVSELYAPCSGKIVEINNELAAHPEVVNSDPYGLGWMVKVELSDPGELDMLLDSEGYKNLVGK